MSIIAKNLNKVRSEIASSATKSGRKTSDITLLAVSKTRPANDIRIAANEGQVHFGENYLQESLEKINELKALGLCWHFIGPLQSNKTRAVAENFDWLHTLDRFKIAKRLSEQRPADLAPLNVCIQVNISNEESKSGCLPSELTALVNVISELPNICVRGLMAIPKATQDAQEQQVAFAKMKALQLELQAKYPQLDTLSMGMSGDMDAAIAEGSTIVRIGTAIFGPRAPKSA
ncbi:YggS family pyridoxal phosphate-dependent enzyme [Neptuniibacter sp. QD29_5]|uniref:YggS family pyridoxal phosphate-dependent enzyme n=1 Tax=Neptuniibacter sp. QD29_5 TaxID=3398207 RepID=UPI0039F609A0